MRTLFTFLLIALFSYHPSMAQSEIAVVDVEASVYNWLKAIDLENVFERKRDSLQVLGEIWAGKLQAKYWHLQKILEGSDRLDEENRRAKELAADQKSIMLFERLLTDTIPAFKEKIVTTIRTRILEKIVTLSKTGQYKFVFQKKHILYQEIGYPVAHIEIPYTKVDAQYLATTIGELKQKLASTCTSYRQKIERDYP